MNTTTASIIQTPNQVRIFDTTLRDGEQAPGYSMSRAQKRRMAQVLADRGVDGFVFRGDDGLDEITLATTTSVFSIGNGEISNDLIDPLDFGISRAPIEALVGGDSSENARITTAIFAGEKGAPRDAVVLNAAAAIAAYEAKFELNLHDRIAHGVSRAIDAIDSGASTRLIAKWAELSQKLGA
jgi:anthranilate phosphoribosyltransferase